MTRVVAAAFMLSTVAIAAAPSAVTFHKDVLPILQEHCQACHRPGQVAPMSFLTYNDVRPWAKAVKSAVTTGKMPPWFADAKYGHFANDRSLKKSDIDVLVAWADRGAPEGDPKDGPPEKQWPAGGWLLQPDIILDGPEFEVPTKGVIDWFWVAIPSNFIKDTWVTSIEFLPLDPALVHHVGIAFVPHSPDVKYGEPIWQRIQRDADLITIPGQKQQDSNIVTLNAIGGREQDTYLPGHPLADYRIYNAAKLIPANTDIYLNLHYTPNGKPARTHVRVGFTVAKETPKRKLLLAAVQGPSDREHFRIPANDGNWAAPPAEATFAQDVEVVSMIPHMHVRGKEMTYTLTYPDGRAETVLHVPNYDFNWQLEYDTSIKVPKGTKLRVDAHYDNSVNNKYNPNPSKDVFFGLQSWEEMMTGYLGVVVNDLNLDPRQLFTKKNLTARADAQ